MEDQSVVNKQFFKKSVNNYMFTKKDIIQAA